MDNPVRRAIKLSGGTLWTLSQKTGIRESNISRWAQKGYIHSGAMAKIVSEAVDGQVTLVELVTPPVTPTRRRDKRKSAA